MATMTQTAVASAAFTQHQHVPSLKRKASNSLWIDGMPVFPQDYKHNSYITPIKNPKYSTTITITPITGPAPPQPTTQKALTVCAKGKYALVDSFPVPQKLGPKEVMIRNCAVGLNPIDWKSVDYNFCLPEFPWVTGREMAGVVERVGEEVREFKKGDPVWTSTYYRDVRAGCFQELVTVPEHTVSPIPSDMSFSTAASLGVGPLTASMTLWKWLNVPMSLSTRPSPSAEYLLVWGGSAVTGQFAIQVAVRGGLKVIAVASLKTVSLVRSLGAEVVTRDNKSNEEILAEIVAIGGEKITRGIDLVGNKTAVYSLKALSKTRPASFAPLAFMGKDEVPGNVKVHTVEMKRFVLDEESGMYAKELNALVETGAVRLPEVEVMSGGLEMVEEGLERVKRGDMGGKKVVVSLV